MPPVLANLALLAPAALLLAAWWPADARSPRPRLRLLLCRLATAAALLMALLAVALVATLGATTGPLLGGMGTGLSVRLDAVSCSMFVLVAFVGVIVVQYSRNYMDGDARQGAFMSGLCLTLAAVLAMVLAGNLTQLVVAWIATSLTLHRLLVFYRERRPARMAAHKKFILARIGDVCLIGASVLLIMAFGSTDIATILTRAHTLAPGAPHASVQVAALLIGIAALLKSAQFPSQGWLPEVMDTPTPVSALLHAGIINAGGFLMIRFADVMLVSEPALHLIALVGGFTALFGGVVMLTQTSVKGSLAWSTVAQMGFMTLQCGLGAFAIALLHLVAHSLYKAHAFLSSGSVVEVAPAPSNTRPRILPVLTSLALALALYAAIGWIWGVFARGEAAVLTLGGILVLGVSMLMVPAMHAGARRKMLARMLVAAGASTVAYFVLESFVVRVTASILPPIPQPDALGLLIMGLAIVSFAAVAVLQGLSPVWLHRPAWRSTRVHLANGLYINAYFNRMVGALRRDAGPPADPRAASRIPTQ
ncbi:proton-conducting transporter membrane subunit [Oleiagrimonas sp.]|jgi:NAD(P)H-quinone oxidoreductase subunit 5|uniref:proton-conducting transporter transmembrane domain-containing protein n=1 Tax=Oleiagrimonas sp. TaxID=2010330 RepID=UPI00263566A9|nr:proton-conducting transporter membrane subunit [Oleiagrimonas sp.]MDA3915082.1 proton-conducting transporter membrane subunit [Oleiagrimonas sp.]